MTDQPKRRGGWPGPRKPSWSFRPTASTEAVVAAYVKAHGLDAERDRSRAINALIEIAAPTLGPHCEAGQECCGAIGGECCEHCLSGAGT